jgi:hypothetical protein
VYNGSGYSSPVYVTSSTTVHDQIFIQHNGREWAVQLSNFNIACREGHHVTAVWAIKNGDERGPYILVANHTTGESYRADTTISQFVRSGSMATIGCLGYLAFLVAMGVVTHGVALFFLIPFGLTIPYIRSRVKNPLTSEQLKHALRLVPDEGSRPSDLMPLVESAGERRYARRFFAVVFGIASLIGVFCAKDSLMALLPASASASASIFSASAVPGVCTEPSPPCASDVPYRDGVTGETYSHPPRDRAELEQWRRAAMSGRANGNSSAGLIAAKHPLRPAAGMTFSVTHVAANDLLNVRASPNPDAAKIAAYAPNATGIRGTGRSTLAFGTTWIEVETAGGRGWVNQGYLTEAR